MKGIIFLLLSCLLAFVMFTGCGSGKEEKPVVSPPEIEWSKTFGGSGEEDGANFIQQTADGGYILAGQTMSPGLGAWDFWVAKTDDRGEEQWSKTFVGPSDERAFSVQETTDGGYVVAGSTDSYGLGGWDFWVVKTDAVGARVTIKSGKLQQSRDVVGVMGYLSQGDLRPHFGLGRATKVDRGEVRWPDGSLQRLDDVPANQILTVVQGAR